MSSINMMGSYSGIDMSVIDQLMEAEKSRGTKYTRQKQDIEREQSAWKDINTRLDSLFNKADALSQKETFESNTVTSNVKDSTSLTVTANDDAAVGTYRVSVNKLATSSRLTGNELENIDSIYDALEIAHTPNSEEPIFTISGHEGSPIEIDLSIEDGIITDSLKDIENLINEKTEDTGIRASIVADRLVLTDTEYGDQTISVGGTAAEALGFDGDPNQLETGQSAEFTVNGLTITSESNTVDDVIEGLTFELQNIHEGSDEVITVAADTAKTTKAVKEFVEQYNSTMSFITNQMDVGDPSLEDNETGALTGDGTLMRLESGLRQMLTTHVTGGATGGIVSAEDLGIEVDRYGVATFDEAKFNEALQEDPANVGRFFYRQETVQEAVEGSETGETRPVIKREGLSELFKNFVDTYISSSDGVITNKSETYDRMMKDIDQQIETFNERLERKRDRYIQQFTALDIAMMEAESQMSYMNSQLGMDAQ